MHRLWGLSLVLAGAWSAGSAFGWGDLGHQTVAAIAEKKLSEKAKQMVLEILGAEPLAIAATFPDHVRPVDDFDPFKSYHFFEVPVGSTPADMAKATKTKKSANTILALAPDTLIDVKRSREQKMLLLRYILHVGGDVHQPLHVGNGVDMGANLCIVRWVTPWNKKGVLTNLHTVWDENIFEYTVADYVKTNPPKNPGEKRYFSYADFARELLEHPQYGTTRAYAEKAKLAMEKGGRPDPLEWYGESRSLHVQVYPDKPKENFTNNPELRPYCKRVNPQTKKTETGAYVEKQIRPLDEAYARQALVVATSQILKGGYRVAQLLNHIADQGGFKDIDPKAVKSLLDSVQLEHHAE